MTAIHLPLPHQRAASPARQLARGAINGWVIAGMLVLGISAVLPVLQDSTATSQGFKIQDMQASNAKIEAQISQTEADVAALTSLARIQRRATELGLMPGQKPIYVTITAPGPAPAKLPAEYLPEAGRSKAGPDSWWRPSNSTGQSPTREEAGSRRADRPEARSGNGASSRD